MRTQRIADQEWKPNLLIAGFAKWEATELCDYLSQHLDIFLPFEKEPNTLYDLAKYRAYFLGDRSENARKRIFSLNDYYELFSKGKKYRYRIDATRSYMFDPRFPNILKSFSKNGKVILLIRIQTHSLASRYLFSFVYHKENDFARWLHDYFIPYMKTYLYYDSIALYYHGFGDSNLRIIEANSLSSEDVHTQLFEYLEVEPIKISITHKNANLLGPADSKACRQLILTLISIRLETLGVAQQIGLEKQASSGSYMIDKLDGELFKKTYNKKNNNYSDIIELIPDTVSSILDEDYRKMLNFAVQKRVLIYPEC